MPLSAVPIVFLHIIWYNNKSEKLLKEGTHSMILLKRIACGMIAAAGMFAVRCSEPEDSNTVPETSSVTETTGETAGTESTALSDGTEADGTKAGQDTDRTAEQGGTDAAAEQSGTGAKQAKTTAKTTEQTDASYSEQAKTVKTNQDGLIEFPYIEIR